METKKNISYLNKDFGQFRKNLIDFTKQYFPNTYNDFHESSPGMVFVELAAYVGDVLSYYTDTNLKESMLEQATERSNIYDIAKTLGYKPKNVVPAHVTLDIYQLLPAKGSGATVSPDFSFALNILSGLIVNQTNGNAKFRTTDSVDFNYSSSLSPTEITVYEIDSVTKQPTYFLLKKQVDAVSGDIKQAEYSFGSPVAYDKILLPDTNIIEIISVTESDGDAWYEVPYLAQDTIFEEAVNLAENDPELSIYRANVPSLLKLKKTAKRYITRIRSDNKIELQFGSGVSEDHDAELIPNPKNVGNGLLSVRNEIDIDIDPSNFLYTRAYGQAPANTTLTVQYSVGTGLSDNVESNVLTKINEIKFNDDVNSSTNASALNFIKNTVTVNNPEAAAGARTADSLQDIKNNALANFATQARLVTREDYIIRTYSMPAKFGSIAKAYIIPDDQISQKDMQQSRIANPLAMNLYVLGFNQNKQLTHLNDAVKENLKTYLDHYRILTDAVNIKNAFIINIGIQFEITVLSNYNSNEVLLNCINAIKTYFSIDSWQINQPIIKSDLVNTIGSVRGVQNVVNVVFENLYDTEFNYSGNVYDLNASTKNGIIYPSLDPSIFELKFPDQDIKGRVVSH
jgi:hypothetical protein